MKIKSIITKDETELELGEKLTVLVGPNNTGKSRTLLDIRDIFQGGYTVKTILVKKLIFEKTSLEEFKKELTIKPHPTVANQHQVSGLSPILQGALSHPIALENLKQWCNDLTESWQNVCNHNVGALKITLLNADLRLSLARQKDAKHDVNAPEHAIQELYDKKIFDKYLEEAFKRAFDNEIKLDATQPGIFQFRIAKKFEPIPADQRDARPIMEKYQKLDEQGDGYKSFVGIVMGIVISQGRIVLIDEPEAFLHPTQARVLGEWIAKHSRTSDTQIILATHGADILDGILVGDKDTAIFRLNRTDDTTTYKRISPEITSQLASTPLVSSQPVLQSIFYRGVVVCEGDSDRVIYESVYHKESKKRELLFIAAFGKQAIKKIVKPLKDANIPVCAIADIDILNSAEEIKELILAFDEQKDSTELLSLRSKIAKSIEGIEEGKILEDMKKEVKIFLTEIEGGQYDHQMARSVLDKIREGTSKWKQAKKNGVDGVPEEVREDAKRVLEDLKKLGLFIPPVGELESWIDAGTTQPWILEAVKKINEGVIPEPLKNFIKQIVHAIED